MGDDDEALTRTVEEQLADEDHAPDPDQTQPLSKEDLQETEVAPKTAQELAEENAETSLDQPSDSTS